jgi:hypothetical protein
MNTAMSENVMEMMVKPISRAPLSAASNGRIPPSMWRTMFSSMTMASSTTKPTESVNARASCCSRKIRNIHGRASADERDRHGESGMTVADNLRRNKKITSTTR